MDPITFLALGTLMGAILVSSIGPQMQIPKWLYDQIWAKYMEQYDEVSDSMYVRWDRMLENNELPVTIVPPAPGPDLHMSSMLDIPGFVDTVGEASGGHTIYFMTPDEMGWLDFIEGRYLIEEVLRDAIKTFEGPDGEEVHVLYIDRWDIALALAREGLDRGPMLSDDTVLQAILWTIGPLQEEDHMRVEAAELVGSHVDHVGRLSRVYAETAADGADEVMDALLDDIERTANDNGFDADEFTELVRSEVEEWWDREPS